MFIKLRTRLTFIFAALTIIPLIAVTAVFAARSYTQLFANSIHDQSVLAERFSVGSTKYWEQHPLWNTIDEPMKGYRQAAAASRMIGYAGPPSARATEVYSKYILTDMYAKACQGMKAEDAVKWASGELGKIYG